MQTFHVLSIFVLENLTKPSTFHINQFDIYSREIIINLYLPVNTQAFPSQSFWQYIVSCKSYKITCMAVPHFHLCFISMTESIYKGFTAMILIYFIQINIRIKINISIECLFMDVLDPIIHQALQTNNHTALIGVL